MNRKDKGTSGSSRTKMKMSTKGGSGTTGARSIKERPKTSSRANSRANTHSPKKVKKSGGMLSYVIVTLITFGAIVSDITGPFQGWLRPKKSIEAPKEEPKEEVKKAPVKKEKPKPVKEEIKKEEVKPKEVFQATINDNLTAEEVEEADEEKLKNARYEEIYTELKAKVKKPPLNKRVQIRMKDGRKLYCYVTKVGTSSLDLEKIEPYNGKMSVSASKLSDQSKEMFFGDQFAKIKARKIVAAEERQGYFKKDPATESGFFDPTIEETPERLVHAVKEVGDWLNFQARRGSGSAVVRLGAKKKDSARILYVYLGRPFFSQSVKEKTQWLEAVRQFWVLRCKSNSLATEENAHVCLVLDGRNLIVGGTKEEDSKKIWLKKTRR
ncbi:hypothetical protein PQO01_13620 [Lentisphaera marina]|uniref:hypothetical protein n=1 Tax=Lentisphaera marina TaxID=1111041 RepID=UPI002366A466|nr:hypothetical protein [Lentisphaera marina]MDD7985984.1 hypothetical protein [Lentisphaera marina]